MPKKHARRKDTVKAPQNKVRGSNKPPKHIERGFKPPSASKKREKKLVGKKL